ncbi:MAG: hypothetical protein ACRD1Z_09560 [Vicinamibacteria bacterium]
MKEVPPAAVERAKERVIDAGRKAARAVGKSLHRAIRVAADYAVHLHKDDKMSKDQAIRTAARAVLRTVKTKR